ncbi:MAG TPA: putative porin, partial [Chitinophagaceae bacterium]|nr:putative porin [Chitinophagaceae bacterium]
GGGTSDSLKRRDKFEDSLTINFRFLDSTRNNGFDTTAMLNDFTTKFPIPSTYVYLGNTGNAARSLIFAPTMKAGWDPGFHAFDIYKWKLENVRFFTATRPYTELGYVLGSKGQQMIDLIHTQNLRPYWNVALQYRLINAPGFFLSQKTNHNNYLITSWYEAPKKRYNNFVALVTNKLQSGESGGLADMSLLDNKDFRTDNIPTKIGGDPRTSGDFFNNPLNTGNLYKEFNFLLRQQYDIGTKDSIVTDSTVLPLFYPRLRFEHSFKFGKYNYRFLDKVSDSAYYDTTYGIKLTGGNRDISITDGWREISNDFSIYQFPDAKNIQQFIKLGIEYQLLQGEFKEKTIIKSFYNFIGHGEYRNRTRNQKWDMLAFGRLHMNGLNAGDYHAYVSLQRLLSKTLGSLQVGFENVNRSPSFTYNNASSFYLDNPNKSFQKENTLHFFGRSLVPKFNLQLSADYYLVSNYLYLKEYYKLQQESALFNFLLVSASKKFILTKRWNLYSDVWLQQKAGNVELNTPLFFTRQRLAYEGRFFKNLNLSTGVEVRYHSPYKGDDYSPVLGRFFYQDKVTINNTPELSAFMHFRIRSFKAYIRVENLNTLEYTSDRGLSFTNNNLAAPNYAYPGMVIRFGLYWSFVN